jgi:hypothetical protein
MCLFGLVVLGLVGGTFHAFSQPQPGPARDLALPMFLGIFATIGVAIIFYVICMALIELYKVLISIEDSARKNNTLVAAQIDLMGKLAENTNY